MVYNIIITLALTMATYWICKLDRSRLTKISMIIAATTFWIILIFDVFKNR